MATHPLDQIVEAKDAGAFRGVASICSAHPVVLEETLRHAVAHNRLALVEATCNQVNQDGGYTGMRPADFHAEVTRLARAVGAEPDQLLLGGDHLGPNPWRREPLADAMAKAEVLVRQFVAAGYRKIHLDASMRCADDDPARPLSPTVIAARTAGLAAVAEDEAARRSDPQLIRYVIGTEVPVPGGAGAAPEGMHVTSPADADETIAVTRAAFAVNGIDDAWTRVRLVVAQPGVEFSDTELHEYERGKAAPLAEFIRGEAGLAFEAHSTDYQTVATLRALVADHFVVLKVGPALTNAYREGVFALSYIEDELLGESGSSRVRDALDAAMCDNAEHWSDFYAGDAAAQRRARQFSRSDRSRYYWPASRVAAAVEQMHAHLGATAIPQELLAQFLPVQYRRVREGQLANEPGALLRSKVEEVLDDYLTASV
jgi:D-tagatose-1,6-bisphosphate aldolase subunit GatZ/KbaZ